MLPVELHRIDDADRLDEDELWPAWRTAHPRILGALLDLAAGVARMLPSIRLASKPRMADFARILAAVDQVIGSEGLKQYRSKQEAMARDSLTDDPFVAALAAQVTDTFTGTSAELLTALTPADDGWRPPRGWPVNAREVTQRLHRQAPVMRKAGWSVSDDGARNHTKVVRWTITCPPKRGRNP
jgi:hypothetical protein